MTNNSRKIKIYNEKLEFLRELPKLYQDRPNINWYINSRIASLSKREKNEKDFTKRKAIRDIKEIYKKMKI